MSAEVPRRLGRGLESLIATAKQQREPQTTPASTTASGRSELQRIKIADITPNQFQPRRTFTDTELSELAASLRTNGLLQPITVRLNAKGGWELVAGERRLRAATLLGWTEVPALVRDFDDRAMLTLALVENLQRADLNSIEEADGYQRLIAEFQLTQQQVADAVGKDRTTITNLLRILGLPLAVRTLIEEGRLSTGHARALLQVKDARTQLKLAKEIVQEKLSVRDAETRARTLNEASGASKSAEIRRITPKAHQTTDPMVRRIETQLRTKLQTDVTVQTHGKQGGVVRLAFYSDDDLERLTDLLLGPAKSDYS